MRERFIHKATCVIIRTFLSMPIRGSRRPNVVPIAAPSFSSPPRPYIYRKIAYAFIALTVIIVVAVLWLSSMNAQVLVKVKRESVKIDHVVEIAKTPRPGQLAGRVAQGELKVDKEFPLRAATTTVLTEGSVSATPAVSSTPVSTSSVATTSDGIARGTVRVVNQYSKPQTLVRTTRLLTADGKLFRIDRKITIPAGGEVSVEAYADKSGSEFAIGPTRFTIPGLYVDLQKFIYAVSDASFTIPSGTKTVATPTPAPKPVTTTPTRPRTTAQSPDSEQIQAAFAQVREQALSQLKQNLAASIGDVGTYEPVYFVTEETKTAPGSTPDTFVASVKVAMTAVYYPKDDMLVLVRSKLKDKVPSDRELIPFDNQEVTYSVESVDPRNETATIRVKATAGYRITSNTPALQKSALAGKTKEEIQKSLKALDGVEDIQVLTRPGWLTKLPSLQDHIDVKIE